MSKIAAVQMISGPDVGPNLVTAARLIEEAVAAGAQLLVLPEYFPLIGADDTAQSVEQRGCARVRRIDCRVHCRRRLIPAWRKGRARGSHSA